jgi:hypothetical protein
VIWLEDDYNHDIEGLRNSPMQQHARLREGFDAMEGIDRADVKYPRTGWRPEWPRPIDRKAA